MSYSNGCARIGYAGANGEPLSPMSPKLLHVPHMPGAAGAAPAPTNLNADAGFKRGITAGSGRPGGGSAVPSVQAEKPGEEIQEIDLQHDDEEMRFVEKHWSSQFVIYEHYASRKAWNLILCTLLLYTATVFPYQLCFLEFRIPDGCCMTKGWEMFNATVDVLFWLDFFINFFLTYPDRHGNEVDSLSRIVWNYLRGTCALNLIACLPEGAALALVNLFVNTETGGLSKMTRIVRIQRLSRITRMTRLVKLVNNFDALRESPLWIMLQQQRGVRIVNFVCGLLWAVHLMACGWYLCGALHPRAEVVSWVARREIEPGGGLLVEADPITQWWNSMYFVLTVFSTVGFGDMSAWSNGEIIYVCITMVVGAVVHSIIISEVIGAIRSVDDSSARRAEQKKLVTAFAYNAELSTESVRLIEEWIDLPLKGKAGKTTVKRFNREAMKKFLCSGGIPREILGRMPEELYRGKLMRNRFVLSCATWSAGQQMPPRFPLLLAVACNRHIYLQGEVVYQVYDHPFKVGSRRGSSCSLIAPSPDDSHELAPQVLASPYQLYCFGSYFGESELLFPGLLDSGHTRVCTTRCETRTAQTLVVSRENLAVIVDEFPQFHVQWRITSTYRERCRRKLLSRLTHHRSYRTFAASSIQKFVRQYVLTRADTKSDCEEDAWNPTRSFGMANMAVAVDQASAAKQNELARKKKKFENEDVMQTYDELEERVDKLSASVHEDLGNIRRALQKLVTRGIKRSSCKVKACDTESDGHTGKVNLCDTDSDGQSVICA
eukprot:TRINITY_DN30523_c0_g2_i1.p1 TRINITY_DN30523_c0_g2~~TRINITY_DN30523_c0_g2_i1.p1  ORF type:complete len:775 (+),score=106.40 TRINITY_DN30523_c0_g2_i1:67-2391(+)